MAFNTGNAVPSSDAKDLSDNAENFDSAVNTQADTWEDRLAVTRDTVNGRIKKMGYTVPIVYAGGELFTVNDNVKTVDEGGVVYAPLPSALPFTTSGTFVGDDDARFFVVQGLTNDQLINDLSQTINFALMSSYVNFGALPVGKRVYILERDTYFTCIAGTLTANTYNIVASTSVNQSIQLVATNNLTPKMFGIFGGGVTDDTVGLQALLYANGDGNAPPASVLPVYDDLIIHLEDKHRITAQLHQPSHVQVIGNAKLISNPVRGTDVESTLNSKTCMIIVDFAVPLQSAWVIAGYSRNGFGGFTDNDYIDPWKTLVSDLDFTSGDITRSYKCKIVGVQFYTEDLVGCAVSVAACPDAEVRISTYGFLTGAYISTSWTCTAEIYGLSYHCGVFLFSPNAVDLSGYVSGFVGALPTPLDVTNAPAGWQTTVTTSYGATERYWTTGAYMAFVNACTTTSFTAERYDRSRLYWTCEGITENSPYIEAIEEVAFHNINSTVVVNANQLFACPYIVSSGGGEVSTGLTINNYKQGDAEIALTVQSIGPYTKINTGQQSKILDNDKFSTAVSFDFQGDDELNIFVDPTLGDNANCGLTMLNAVKDVRDALRNLNHYGDGSIIIKEGETAEIGTTARILTRTVNIKPETTSAGLTFNVVGPAVSQIETTHGSSLSFDDLIVTVDYGGATGDTRGAIRSDSGTCSVSMNNCATTMTSSAALFTSRSDSGSIINFSQSSGTITGDILASNSFTANGTVKLIRSKGSVVESGTLTVQSNFTEI